MRWGILGPGAIATQFAQALRALPQARLAAVASRELARAEGFARDFSFERAYGSYEQLVNDPEIDIVYIATPHAFHCEQSLLCLNAGKAVLCEKPLCVSEAEGRLVVEAARRNGRFLMEAMWTRFLPLLATLRELLAEGVIGEVQMLTADFGFPSSPDPQGRLLNPALAGGGLLDVGVYPISLAHLLLGEPQTVSGQAVIGPTGVDVQAAWNFGYSGGRIACGQCSLRAHTPQEATVSGTRGYIRIHSPWWRASALTVHTVDGTQRHIECSYVGNGYGHEAEAAMECMARGELEHPQMTHEESLSVLRSLDRLRKIWITNW